MSGFFKPSRRDRIMAADAYERSRQVGVAFGREGDAWMIKNAQSATDGLMKDFEQKLDAIQDRDDRDRRGVAPITAVRSELALFLGTIAPLRQALNEKAETGLAHWKRRLTDLGHDSAFDEFVKHRLDSICLPAYAIATDFANCRITTLMAQGCPDEYNPV